MIGSTAQSVSTPKVSMRLSSCSSTSGTAGQPVPRTTPTSSVCNDWCMNVTGSGDHRAERDAVVDAVLSASRVLVAVAARSLAEVADEVTLTQYRSLVVLASRGPQSVAALAEAVAVTPPTASRLCDRLVRKGLIRRREDARDRRAVRLALSKAGRELVDAVTARRRAEIARLLDAVPLDAQRSIVTSLGQLAEAAGEVPEQDWTTGWDL
jgi:DNA-binding MarR family transcriptional regulator